MFGTYQSWALKASHNLVELLSAEEVSTEPTAFLLVWHKAMGAQVCVFIQCMHSNVLHTEVISVLFGISWNSFSLAADWLLSRDHTRDHTPRLKVGRGPSVDVTNAVYIVVWFCYWSCLEAESCHFRVTDLCLFEARRCFSPRKDRYYSSLWNQSVGRPKVTTIWAPQSDISLFQKQPQPVFRGFLLCITFEDIFNWISKSLLQSWHQFYWTVWAMTTMSISSKYLGNSYKWSVYFFKIQCNCDGKLFWTHA